MEKFILYGIENDCKKILDTCKGVEKYIYCYIDPYTKRDELYGINVYRPYVLNEDEYCEYKIIVTLDNKFHEIYDYLMDEYGIRKDRILTIWQFLSYILEDTNVKLNPTFVRIESSTLCQLDCKECYMRKSDNGTMGYGYLKADVFQKFLDENSYVKKIELSNSGEAFLNPDMEKILRLACERNVEINFSAGVNFNDVSDSVLEALVECKVNKMTLSIDGASQEIYSLYRKNGNFDRVIENIKKLNAIKKRMDSEYPKLTWQFILMQHNQYEAEKASEMAKELNMDIRFKLNWAKEEFVPYDSDKLCEVTGLNYFTRTDYNAHNEKNYYVSSICKQMLFSPQINWDGRLLGCCTVFKNDWGVNVFKEGLEWALNSEQYRNAIIGLAGGNKDVAYNSPCGRCSKYKQFRSYTVV